MAIKVNQSEIPGTVIEAKRWWRRKVREALRGTTEDYRRSASDAITAAFLGMEEYRAAGTVLAYCSTGMEVGTAAMLEAVLADGKRLCLPKCTDIGEDGKRKGGEPSMEARQVTDLSLLESGAYGIPEPPDSPDFPVIEPQEIDLILLPCMTCDPDCRRLGHGGGYYDKFLSMIREDCATIAICYEAVLADQRPTEPHDMPVDAAVTEETVYRWRPQEF